MDAAEIQAKLREGIEAVRAGDRSRGRRLLLDVVMADERQEPAWLWLAAVLEAPADQIMALENALALNPANAAAQRRLEALRGEAAPAPASAPPLPEPEPLEPSPPAPEPEAPPRVALTTGVDSDDDPLQCPFCGQLTAEADQRCPHCRRSLLAPGAWRGGCYLYSLLIVLGLNVQAALVQAAVPLAVQSLAQQPAYHNLYSLLTTFIQPMELPFWGLALRGAVLFGLLALFLNETDWGYALAAGLLGLDLAFQGLAAWQGWWPRYLLIVNAALTGVAWLFTLAALVSQQLARRRLYTTLDYGLHGGPAFHRRGREHLRAGRLALAIPHFQKAVILEPKALGYYKDLAAALVQMRRYEKARLTLQAGAQRAPGDPEFQRLLAEVERLSAAPPPPR